MRVWWVFGGFGGLTVFGVLRGRRGASRGLGLEVWVALKKAIWSLRLRLHSGLRQQGRGLRPRFMRPEAKASGYLFVLVLAGLKPCPTDLWWALGMDGSGRDLWPYGPPTHAPKAAHEWGTRRLQGMDLCWRPLAPASQERSPRTPAMRQGRRMNRAPGGC